MKLDMTHSQDSYSMAAMERMKTELDSLVKKLNEVGSALATLNLFRRADIELDGKKRRLRDFAEIDLGPDPMAGTFKVIIHNEVAIPGAISILKENNFAKMFYNFSSLTTILILIFIVSIYILFKVTTSK